MIRCHSSSLTYPHYNNSFIICTDLVPLHHLLHSVLMIPYHATSLGKTLLLPFLVASRCSYLNFYTLAVMRLKHFLSFHSHFFLFSIRTDTLLCNLEHLTPFTSLLFIEENGKPSLVSTSLTVIFVT